MANFKFEKEERVLIRGARPGKVISRSCAFGKEPRYLVKDASGFTQSYTENSLSKDNLLADKLFGSGTITSDKIVSAVDGSKIVAGEIKLTMSALEMHKMLITTNAKIMVLKRDLTSITGEITRDVVKTEIERLEKDKRKLEDKLQSIQVSLL